MGHTKINGKYYVLRSTYEKLKKENLRLDRIVTNQVDDYAILKEQHHKLRLKMNLREELKEKNDKDWYEQTVRIISKYTKLEKDFKELKRNLKTRK